MAAVVHQAPLTPTARTYYLNTYNTEMSVTIIKIGKDKKGLYLIFNATLFHPKGGGQPDDRGWLRIGKREFEVIGLEESAEKDRDTRRIKHYIKIVSGLEFTKGDEIGQRIDLVKRLEYARLHTAGHLLASVVETVDPTLEGYAGHHFPGEARVVFKMIAFAEEKAKATDKPKKGGAKNTPSSIPSLQKEKLEKWINEVIAAKRPIVTANETSPRTVGIHGFKAYPCGGTHLKNVEEIGRFAIRKIEKKKEEVRIGYEIFAT